MLSCYIIDDDIISINILQKLCKDSGAVEVIGSATSGTDALNELGNASCDFILLDIEMPDVNGYELMKSFPGNPSIVVVSSEAENAVQAFENDVVDFLLKPISKGRFLQSIKKINDKKNVSERLQNTSSSTTNQHFFVKKSDVYVKVTVDDIRYLEAANDYVEIHTAKSHYLVNSTLSHFLEMLPKTKFCKIHRSYIVNTEFVDSLGDNMIKIGEKLLPVSRSGKKELEQFMPLL